MAGYIILIFAFAVGMSLYAILRRREVDPFLSGFASIALAMLTVIGYFAVVIISST